MSSLLLRSLPVAAGSVVHHAAFSTSAVVHAARGGRNKKKSKSKPKSKSSSPPPPSFERDSAPHEGRAPTARAAPRRRAFDINGGGAAARRGTVSSMSRSGGMRLGMGRGPLAAPSAVAPSRRGGALKGVEGGAMRSRDRDRRASVGRSRDSDAHVDERTSSPSSFHRSVERASREKHRLTKQLESTTYDTDFPPASASRSSTLSSTYTEYDRDRPLEYGAYDAPELAGEFYHPPTAVSSVPALLSSTKDKGKDRSRTSPASRESSRTNANSSPVPTRFTTSPLFPGLVASLQEMLGPAARPTPIQALSLAHLLPFTSTANASPSGSSPDGPDTSEPARKRGNGNQNGKEDGGWSQYLLASETGSGKSLAYLLPMLQRLKMSEPDRESSRSSRLLAVSPSAASPISPPPDSQPPTDIDTRSEVTIPVQKKPTPRRLHNPRALVLAPTHELARQLAGAAKGLLRAADDVKLRVLCASRANVDNSYDPRSAYDTESHGHEKNRHPVDVVVGTPMKLLEMARGRGFDGLRPEEVRAMREDAAGNVGLERRFGWEDENAQGEYDEQTMHKKYRRGRDRVVHHGKWKKSAVPEMGLSEVEWVVVDEADVLFDPDFVETTRALLADVSAARADVIPSSSSVTSIKSLPAPTSIAPSTHSTSITKATSTTTTYPFNLILTSATIPKALNAYLTRHHPGMLRLASPRLHRLPKALQTEYVGWTGGNKFADVLRRLRRVWAEDAANGGVSTGADVDGMDMGENGSRGRGSMSAGAAAGGAALDPKRDSRMQELLRQYEEWETGKEIPASASSDKKDCNTTSNNAKTTFSAKNTIPTPVELSKVIVFCNRSAKVAEFSAYLAEQGIKSVALTSTSEQRLRGSNGHLAGFLKESKSGRGKRADSRSHTKSIATTENENAKGDVKNHAHVLITTSLLSRGLDFAPGVRHVFIVDEPRNTIDFIHRAGRTARAGERGRVVIFGKMKGRGSARTKVVRQKVGALMRA